MVLTKKKNRIGFLITILLQYYVFTVYPQQEENYKFDRLTSENIILKKGLSQNTIFSMLQDNNGYMWFGTWDGLNKYDGYNFIIYNTSNGLSNQIIYSLLEDDDGILWIGTDKGLNRFDRKSQTFKHFIKPSSDSTNLFHNRINSIIQTQDGSIWLGTGSGLTHFDKKTETFSYYLSTQQEFYSPRSNYINNLYEDSENIIWLSTTYGLVKFDPKTKRSTRYYYIPGDSTGLSHNNIRCVIQEQSGNYWIGTLNGLNYYDTSSKKIKQYFHDPNNKNSISNNWIRVIYEDNSGKIWIGTDAGGLNFYNKENDNFSSYQNIIYNDKSLSNDKIYSIYEDHTGNMWIGTYLGVNRIHKYYNDFKHTHRTSDNNTGLNNNFIWTFIEDHNKNLWIGTSNGINVKNKITGEYTYLTHNQSNPNSLSHNDVRILVHSPELHCIWIGTRSAGMNQYDLATDKITHYLPDPNKNSISNVIVNDIVQGDEGYVWIGTARGLNKFNPYTNTFKIYYHSPDDEYSISNDIIICMMKDSKGNLWIGTNHGLNKFIVSENKFIRYLNDPEDLNCISNNTIFSIYEDKKNIIWAGTAGGGLNKINTKTGKIISYTIAQGLPNNLIYAILEDDNHNLWISTNQGLSKFNIENEQFINYDVKDGLQSNEFNLGARYKDNEGLLYFGGMNGYNVFNPNAIKSNPNKPTVILSAFRKFNELQNIEYLNGDTITLQYYDNFFSFEISALDYTNPSKNKYKYKLEKVDNSWVYTNANNRLAEYKNVRPGTYTFRANGSNNDGIWSDTEFTLTIIIKPAWWNTWTFRIIFGLFLASLIWALIYRRIRQIRIKHEVEKKVLEIEKQKFDLEQKALRLQMNPHFIFNSLNSIQSYILTHDTENAVNYLGKFSQLMRLIMTNSGFKFIPIKEELKLIRYYLELEKLRFENKFDFKISIDENIDEGFIEIPPMIIQPYIENAIIHGLIHKSTKGLINILFKIKANNIICTIEDNGVGREKAEQIIKESGIKRKSKGMLITKARLDILNRQINEEFSVNIEDLKDKNGNATGTKVNLVIHFKED